LVGCLVSQSVSQAVSQCDNRSAEHKATPGQPSW